MYKKLIALGIAFAILITPNMVLAREVAVSDVTLSGGVLTAVITSDEEISAVIYAAKYDESGLLTNLAAKEITLSSGEATYTLENAQDGSKLLLWDTNLAPLTDAQPVNEKQGDGIIHLNENSIDATGVENTEVDGTSLVITAAGTYEIEGTLNEGQITVSDALTKSDKVELVLDGVSVSNSATAPFNGGGAKITLTLKEGTTNTFTDNCTAKYNGYTTEDAPKGAVYSKRDLTIKGSGSLVVNANYKNGLIGGADLEIKKGASVTVNAVNNAIKADNSVEIADDCGDIYVTSVEGDGIKTDAIDSDTGIMEQDKGYVLIEGGTVTINTTAGDGIQADNYISVTGGTLNITSGTEGLKANEVNVPLSADDVALTDDDGNPVCGNGKIYISNAEVTVVAGEDGIKATELVEISDGAVVNVTATAIDETDSSGYDCIQAGETEETVSEDGTTTTKTVVVYGDIKITDSTINIVGCSDDAITANGDVVISGSVVKGKTDGDFIKAYELVEISSGEFEIESTKDGIQAGTALVESTDGTESNYTTGNVKITGGTFNIKTNGGHTTTMADSDPSAKGIKGITDVTITGGEFVIDSADDALHSNYNLTVTGGQYSIATGDDALHADFTLTIGTEGGADADLLIDVSTSYEGIEGSVINVYSGTQYLYATDDGINAAGDYKEDGTLYESSSSSSGSSSGSTRPGGSWGGGAGSGMSDDTSPCGMLYVKGGKVYVEAYGDGMDSNGSIEMSGGVVLINGPLSGGNGVFDIGDSGATFNITGGTLIGAGSSDMAVTPDSISNGYFLSGRSSGGVGNTRPGGNTSSSTSYSAGTPVKITTSTGSIVFVPKVNSSWLFVTTPDMQSGQSYTASTVSGYTGGTQILGKTVGGVFYGLIEGATTN